MLKCLPFDIFFVGWKGTNFLHTYGTSRYIRIFTRCVFICLFQFSLFKTLFCSLACSPQRFNVFSNQTRSLHEDRWTSCYWKQLRQSRDFNDSCVFFYVLSEKNMTHSFYVVFSLVFKVIHANHVKIRGVWYGGFLKWWYPKMDGL